MKTKAIAVGFLVAVIAAAPISSASARDHFFRHGHGHGPLFGLFAAGATVVAGVATVVTAPIAILAGAASGPRYERRRDYDDQRGEDYGPQRGYEGRSRDYYSERRGYDQEPRGYARDYEGRSRDYYSERRGYDQESRGYDRSGGYDAPSAGYYPPPPRAEYAPQRDYAPRGYYAPRPDYYGPPEGEQ